MQFDKSDTALVVIDPALNRKPDQYSPRNNDRWDVAVQYGPRCHVASLPGGQLQFVWHHYAARLTPPSAETRRRTPDSIREVLI